MQTFYIENSNVIENNQVNIAFIEYAHEQDKHIHEGIEIVYIVDGRGEHIVNDTRIKVKRGSLIIMNKDCVHSFTNIEHLKYYNLMFDPSYISDKLKKEDSISDVFNLFGIETNKEFLCVDFENEKINETEKLFYKIFNEGINKDLGYLNIIRAVLEQLLILIFRNYSLDAEKKVENNDVFDDAFRYISEHCCENIKLEEVAELFGYESTHFSRVLKKKFGFGFKQLVVKKKLDRAMVYIWEGRENIDDIILKCGFSNKTYFYEVFEKHYGTKSKYVKEYGKNYGQYVRMNIKKSENDTNL